MARVIASLGATMAGSKLWRGWPLLLVGSVVLLFVVGAATVRESYRGWRVDREIQALESQAEDRKSVV